jgi:hypothetical protein
VAAYSSSVDTTILRAFNGLQQHDWLSTSHQRLLEPPSSLTRELGDTTKAPPQTSWDLEKLIHDNTVTQVRCPCDTPAASCRQHTAFGRVRPGDRFHRSTGTPNTVHMSRGLHNDPRSRMHAVVDSAGRLMSSQYASRVDAILAFPSLQACAVVLALVQPWSAFVANVRRA